MPVSRFAPAVISAALAALVLNSGCSSSPTPAAIPAAPVASSPAPAPREADLIAALKNSDRVDIALLPADGSETPLLTQHKAEAIADFLKTVRIDEDGPVFRCNCPGNQVIRFYTGDRLLAKLTLHHNRQLRWHGGPWAGDATLLATGGQPFSAWFRRCGGDPNALQDSAALQREQARISTADQQFRNRLPTWARQDLPAEGGVTIESFYEPRRLRTELTRSLLHDPRLIQAAIFALAESSNPWMFDDPKTAAVQTALANLPEDQFSAEIRAMEPDDRAMRGVARVYFRFSLHRRYREAFNAEWLPKLADAVLRTGSLRDLPLVLLYLAKADHPAAKEFLREIASGQRSYPWSFACGPRADIPQEPSLPVAAALLLATEGDWVTPIAPPAPLVGLDPAAAEIMRSLKTPSVPLRPAHFQFPSLILGYAAAEALARQPATAISLATLTTALRQHTGWIARRAQESARANGLARLHESANYELSISPVGETLVHEDPAQAVQDCTRHLHTARGSVRGALLILRAAAYSLLGDNAAAIADFDAALLIPGYPREVLHKRLVWAHWREGRLPEAAGHAELGLRLKPDAELFLMRGLSRFAADDFGPASDLDFTAAMALQPDMGYPEIFQHLCSQLAQRPEVSRLSGKPAYAAPQPSQLQFNTGTGAITVSDGTIPQWPATIIAYLKSELTADQLLEKAKTPGNFAATMTHTLEANYYISLRARIAGDTETESRHLLACTAVLMPDVAESQLAHIRLRQLKLSPPTSFKLGM